MTDLAKKLEIASIEEAREWIKAATRNYFEDKGPDWPAPGSEDTELGVSMEPEVDHGEAEVHTRVQA
jgi:hypothetical protein